MRENTLKKKLLAGKRVSGVFMEINSPECVEFFGLLGYDMVLLDAQHCGLTPDAARGLIRAADATGMSSIVRVPKNDASTILQYLELGAAGVMVPNISSLADAEAAVAAMRYPPVGTRGGFGRSRAANYGITQSQREHFTKADNEVLCWLLVEDSAALANLPAICAIPGVDVVAIGPGDLALSMGLPGGAKEKAVLDAIEQIRSAAAAAKRWTSMPASDSQEARALYEQGYELVLASALGLLVGAAKDYLRDVKRG